MEIKCRFYCIIIKILPLEIQLSKGEGWDPVIKWGGLGSSHQKEKVGIPLTGLTLQHFCACPKSEPGFPMSYAVFFYVQ